MTRPTVTGDELGGAPEGAAQRGDGYAVEVSHVFHTYQGRSGEETEALRDVSLSIAEGEFVSIVGPSGCGKSTLLMAVAGLIDATRGEITVEGQQVEGPRRSVGVMFQTPELFPWRTVLENVMLPIDVMRADRSQYMDRATQLLETVGLASAAKSYPRELSGGMQQRAALCRLLVADPHVILMDEPFGALDEFTRERLNLELLRIWDERHKTVLFVTHNIGEAVFLSDRVLVMGTAPGRVLEEITIDIPRPRTFAAMQSGEYHTALYRIRELLGVAR